MMDQLDTWYSTAFGQRVLQAEKQQVAKLLEDRFGYYLVEFANTKRPHFAQLSPIKHKFALNATENFILTQTQSTMADPLELPFSPESIDLIILPHTLDFIEQPAQLLKEVWTCLIPEGYLLLLNFNPYSLWGLYRWWHRGSKVPFNGNYFSQHKLVQLLEAYNFTIEETSSVSFDLPLKNGATQWMYNLWHVLGKLAAPSSANVNLLLARKTVGALTPMRMAWATKDWRKIMTEPGA